MPATLASFSRAPGFKRVLVEVEQDVVDVDDEAARGFARLQDRVELLAQSLAKLRLLGFGLLSGLA